MNRGVIAYIREGNRCAKNTFKNFRNVLKFYFLEIVSFFGSLFVYPIPMMTLARVRVARLAERDEDIQIFKSFEKTDSSKHFWTLFAYYFMISILFLAGIVFITLLAGLFGAIGYLLGGASEVGLILAIIFAAPFGIILLIYLLVFPFMFQPATYLYDCNTNLGLSGMFYNSIDAMRKTGKWTIFMMNLIYSIRHLLWLVLIGGAGALVFGFYDQPAIRVPSAIALLVFIVLYFFRAARLLLGRRIARVCLFNDICSTEKYVSLEQSTEENTPKNIYGVSKRTLRAAKKEQLLLGLFTNGPKLKDPEGVDQSRLPNEVDDEKELVVEEEEVLAQPVPENVVEISDNKNPEQVEKVAYENVRQFVVSTDPEDPTNTKINKINQMDSVFTGTALGLFGMKLATSLLTIVTFGIATPWAICIMQRWYAKHTVINGKQLVFTGTGGQLFGKNFLWTFLTVITFGIYGFWRSINIKRWLSKHTHILGVHGQESKFTADFWGYTGYNLLAGLIKVVSLGFATPWALCMQNRYYAKHTIIDGCEIRFNGYGSSLIGKYILWSFLTVITFGIFSFSFSVRMNRWMTKHVNFVNVERNATDIEEVKQNALETNEELLESSEETANFYSNAFVAETAIEETIEEVVTEQAVEETVEEVISEQAVEETIEEVVSEQAVEETIEEIFSEPVVEETVEEVISEPVVEETIEEVISEQAVEETEKPKKRGRKKAEKPVEEVVTESVVEEPVTVEESTEPVQEEKSMESDLDALLNNILKLESEIKKNNSGK